MFISQASFSCYYCISHVFWLLVYADKLPLINLPPALLVASWLLSNSADWSRLKLSFHLPAFCNLLLHSPSPFSLHRHSVALLQKARAYTLSTTSKCLKCLKLVMSLTAFLNWITDQAKHYTERIRWVCCKLIAGLVPKILHALQLHVSTDSTEHTKSLMQHLHKVIYWPNVIFWGTDTRLSHCDL